MDISRVQLKSNWSVGVRLAASDSKTVWKSRLILSKSLLIFFNSWFGNSFISKELTLKEPQDDVLLNSGNCSDSQMVLRTDHFVDRTFWGSNWNLTEQLVKDCYPLINQTLIMQANLNKGEWTFSCSISIKERNTELLTILKGKLDSLQGFVKIKSWQLLNFSACLHNQLKLNYKIDSSSRQRNDGYFSQQVKCEMVFVLILENASS